MVLKIDILIPTNKSLESTSIKRLILEIDNAGDDSKILPNVIVTGMPVSASTNRNYALDNSSTPIVVMVDDDITGLKPGWLDNLVAPLISVDHCIMTSARLMNADGSVGIMVGEEYDIDHDTVQVEQRQLPTACCAFRNDGTRFDEEFIGSGFEDNDFCYKLQVRYPKGTFKIVNTCKVVHLNTMQNQGGKYWEHNKKYIKRKWGIA